MPLFGRSAPRVDWVVVGLGNPGDGYTNTRHNIGFQVVSRLAKRARIGLDTKAADSRLGEGGLGGIRVAIARPQTFMNDSGRAVGKLLDRYRLEPDRLLVVHDEVDLPLGRLRIRESGSAGTHNGMRSIVARVGEGFPRVRCGIAPADPSREIPSLANYVLAPFDIDEAPAVEAMVVRSAEAIEVAIRDGVRKAMDRFNGN